MKPQDQTASDVVGRADKSLGENGIRHVYTIQKRNAKYRGIEWQFSFEEWLAVWTASGKISERGRGRNAYVMARNGDAGPYSKGNVYICTNAKNAADCRINYPRTREDLRDKVIGTGRGWSFVKKATDNPYQVKVCGKHVGCFPSVETAEAAYSIAVKEVLEFGVIKTKYTRQEWRVAA